MQGLAAALWLVASFVGPSDGDPGHQVRLRRPAVEGPLHGDVQARMIEAVADGIGRAGVEVRRPCAKAPCATDSAVTHDVEIELGLVDHDYRVELRLVDAVDHRLVARSSEVCEVCSVHEAVSMAEAQAAALWTKVSSTSIAPPRLLVRSDPVGATVIIDGRPMGTTPIDVAVSPGTHCVRLERPGYAAQTFDVASAAGVDERLGFELLALESAPARPDRRLEAAGWVTLAVGTLGTAAGATFLGMHGRDYRRRCDGPDIDTDGDCRLRYETRLGGAVALGIGAATMVAGAVMAAVGRKRAKRGATMAWRSAAGAMP